MAAVYLLEVLGVLFLLYLVIKYAARAGTGGHGRAAPPALLNRRAGVGLRRPLDARSRLADANDAPGLYRVDGVDKQTGADVTWDYEAASAANAKVKGEVRDIAVTSVRRAD